MDEKHSGGKAAILILHALVWAAALLGGSYLFKDHGWSEHLFLWMIAGFTLSNGLVMTALGRKTRC